MMIKLINIGLVCAALTACVSVLPEPVAPDALYSVDASTAQSGLAHDVIVREPEAARLMAGQGMVSKGADGGLRMISGVEWSGPATRQIQLAIIDSFETGAAGNAVAPELGILADYELASRISALQLEGEIAQCEMVVSLIATRDRSLIAHKEITAQETTRSRASADRATALKQAASACAAQASAFVIETLQAAP